ncbi:hypothetical protein ACQRBK_00595 [Peptoniphilaceae bacterium SGI.137]|nr:hypothetical protein [Peptoniphilaceae bacterium]MCI6659979.1 hypothetical protein [Peptoniphilaceae bacterium]MDY5841404.1 hypothetical protein [Peptoniphilaceae bacterium]
MDDQQFNSIDENMPQDDPASSEESTPVFSGVSSSEGSSPVTPPKRSRKNLWLTLGVLGGMLALCAILALILKSGVFQESARDSQFKDVKNFKKEIENTLPKAEQNEDVSLTDGDVSSQIDRLTSSVKSELDQSFHGMGDWNVIKQEKTIVFTFTPSGDVKTGISQYLDLVLQHATGAERDAAEENWNSVIESWKPLSAQIQKEYSPYGYQAALAILNPENTQNFILGVFDGEITYNFLDEVK